MNIWLTMHDDIAAFQSLPPAAKLAQLERMANDPDPEIRSRSLVMAEVDRFSADAVCEQLSHDPVEGVRFVAMNYAYFMKTSAIAPRVMEILIHDPSEFVRSHAALAVRRVCSREDIHYLQSLIDIVSGADHEDVPVRTTLIKSIKVLLADLEN